MKKETQRSSVLFLAVVTLLAVAVRLSVRTFVADDWSIYWSDWLAKLQAGGFHALAEGFYDYAPPVMYILYLITLLPLNPMTVFKGICCLLEFAAAILIGKMVLELTGSRKRAEFAYGIFLLWPTVILNAAAWSQCDIIYTLLVLCSMYFLMKDRTWTGMWFYGAAFAVKLQTLFIFPVLIILWVNKKISLKHFITIPVMYLAGIFPAWLAGRPFMELLGIYAFQGSKDRWSLSIKFPNIYQIIGNNFFLDEYVPAGMLLILGILMLVLFYMAYRKVSVRPDFTVLLVVFFGVLTTYFIPHMHERYLYLSDAFLLIYVMTKTKRFPWLVAAGFLSVVGYAQYLSKNDPAIAYGVLAFVQLLLLIRLGLDVYGYLHDPANGSSDETAVKDTIVDRFFRELLEREFRIGKWRFDFLEALLAVCITGTGFLLRTVFETGLPDLPLLLCEWYLAFAAAALVWRMTKSRKKTIGTYGILLILPTMVADGTILRSNGCIGGLLLICILYFLGNKTEEEESVVGGWIFTILSAGLLLYSVKYIGLLFACMVLWQNRRLKPSQLALLTGAGVARCFYTYQLWLQAGYTLTTFDWPNIYDVVGPASIQGQLVDPIALVGMFLGFGILTLAVYLFSHGAFGKSPVTDVRLMLFFLMTAVYFLPYMDQGAGYGICILSVLYFMLSPEEFAVPMILQIVTYAGYQAHINGESMMPMVIFSLLQFGVIVYLGYRLLEGGHVPGFSKPDVKIEWKIRN